MTMKKSTLFILATFLLTIHVNSQKVEYKIKKNNPTPFVAAHVALLHADLWQSNINFGWGARFDAFINNRFSANAKYYTSWGSEYSGQFVGAKPTDMNTKTRHLELIGRFHFADRSEKGQNVILGSKLLKKSGNKSTYNVSYIYVSEAKVRKYFALRGGINLLNSPIIVLNSTVTDGTTSFDVYSRSDLRFGTDYVSRVVTYGNHQFVNVGLSSTSIYNLVVDVSGTKYRDKRVNEFFFDILLMPGGPNLANVSYTNDITCLLYTSDAADD